MKYKLIALDLDGTLKNSQNQITKRTLDCLIRMQEKGIRIVLASGRPTPGLRHEAKALKLDTYEGFLLSFNGARVYDCKTKETIYAKELDEIRAKEVIDFANTLQLTPLTYTDEIILTENATKKHVKTEANLIDIPLHQVDDLKKHLPSPLYKLLLVDEPEHVAHVVNQVAEAFPELSIYRSAPFFIECMAPSIDKAYSLQKLCDHLGITKEEVIAFGDGYNDMPMIEFAGLGVAMDNAVEEVKNVADFITKSNDEDGIAYLLEQLENKQN